MATTLEAAMIPGHDDRPDRTGRRRPFSTWVRKLTNFKASSSGEGATRHSRLNNPMRMHARHRSGKKNNPYPESGYVSNNHGANDGSASYTTGSPQRTSLYSASTGGSGSETSLERRSLSSSVAGLPPATSGARSVALTVSTDHETSRSIVAPSHGASSLAGTARGHESRRGDGSTFSSPAPSERSLATTLTTIQSAAIGGGHATTANHASHHGTSNSQTITFNQPFPTTSPASALPPHMTQNLSTAPAAGPPHPTTYSMATANNLLTDNASILTLASSSKRRRRRSFDTDASVRALAPSSLWGGSRESLPLSVLSANIDPSTMPPTPGLHQSGTAGSSARVATATAAERTSIYSAVGVTIGPPALQSERNSLYAARQSIVGDGASVRSGLLSHGPTDSIGGSAGIASPLASPREDDAEQGKRTPPGESI